MSNQIDLTGFISEDIDLKIGDVTYIIPTDPDVESYVYLLNILNGKFTVEEYLEVQRKLLISLIVNHNKDKQVDIASLKKQLGASAVEQFMKSYIEILIKKGILQTKDNDKKKPTKTKTENQ